MMIREVLFKSVLAFLVLLFFFSGEVHAQFDNKNTADLKSEALANFNSGNYSDALAQFKSLLTRYPKDGVFSYYCGLSLLNMNKDLKSSIEYLEFASSKASVPNQVFYYLGVAYTRNYQFPQAKKAYNQFAAVATKTELKDLMPLRLAEMSDNALTQTTSYNTLDVLASSLFSFSDSNYVKQISAPGGSLKMKPSELLPSSEGIKDITNLMFIPRGIEKNDYVFYAGYGKSKKRGYEIFMVRAGNGQRFSEPVAVEAVNTDYDEIMPYYDPIGKDLYFASRGHSSMGGYDLFKAHHDIVRNTWTDPVNLGFPVNSPSDEFLVIPGTDLGSIMLITDRQGLDSMITAYLLRIHEPRVKLANADPVELKKIGKFGGIEAIPDMVDMSTENILTEVEVKAEPVHSMAPAKRPKPGEAAGQMPADYNKYLRQALDLQFKADSVAKLAREARLQAKSLPDPDERWALQKNIISWEKQSSDFQSKADEYYLVVKQMEKGNEVAKKVPDAIVKDTVINDITLYKYKMEDAVEQKPEVAEPIVTESAVLIDNNLIAAPAPSPTPSPAVEPASKSEKSLSRFVLLDTSPYSANNPFPEETAFPKGSYYKIQLAVLSQNPDWKAFGGLSPVTFETVAGKPMKRYYAGSFAKYEDAKAAMEVVRGKGFPEAFIAGWFDGQKMTVTKVIELEKKN